MTLSSHADEGEADSEMTRSANGPSVSTDRINTVVDLIARRQRTRRVLQTLAVGWVMLALLVFLSIVVPDWRGNAVPLLLVGAPLVLLAALLAGRPKAQDRLAAARRIEETFPALDSALLTALRQRPEKSNGDFGFLQSEVIQKATTHGLIHDWRLAAPFSKVLRSHALHLAALAACGVVSSYALKQPLAAPTAREVTDFEEDAAPGTPFQISIEPGNAEIERGTSLLVMARFTGRLPAQVELVAIDSQQSETRLSLKKSLKDPLFGGRLPEVKSDLLYHIEYDGEHSESFTVKTFVYPELVKADATVQYPQYTELPEKTVEDVRRLTVVEGSTLTMKLELNKPVAQATLVGNDGESIPLQKTTDGHLVAASWSPAVDQKHRYKLSLVDADGRQNRDEPEFVIEVQPNRPPEMKVAFPARDLKVSPLQEVSVKARVSDDFGLKEYGFVYANPTGEETSVVLGRTAPRDEAREPEHQFNLELMSVQPDDLVSYYFYADDVGPDGQPRRTFSDMFFAEVRPWDEVFREGEQPSGSQQQQRQQQGQQGGPSQELLDIQRQVVAAAWNLIRREIRPTPSATFVEDARTLVDSEAEATNQLGELTGNIEDSQMRQHAQAALEQIEAARQRFEQAVANNTVDPLAEGRRLAQLAYQSLLKLQAREFSVTQQQSQQRGQQSGSQQQRRSQLNALELDNKRDRYETEQQAQAQSEQEQQQQENLQVLNRLKELARRQEDLNERIKELENALRNAQNEQEREEIERQLKRLMEEQQEMLRDLDELQQRMEQEQNRSRMADAREQVEQTRERMLRSSEALQEGQTSKALSEGTRAQRELDELQEDFRRESAGQFDEAVQQLRDDVREIAERQADIGQLMRGEPAVQNAIPGQQSPSPQSSLRDEPQADQSNQVTQGLQDQKQRLGAALDQMRDLIEESETSEPLLSKELYDAVREVRPYQPEEALEGAAALNQRGFESEARELEQQAREGIDKLAAGVEKAAEAVLGDQTEALQRARDQLSQLTESIEQELAQNDPQGQQQGQGPEGQEPGERNPRGQRADGQSQDDQQGNPQEQGQPGQGQPGQGQPGQGQPSDPQQNEPPPQGQGGQRERNQEQNPQSNASQGQQPGQEPIDPSNPQQGDQQQSEQQDGQQTGQQRGQGQQGQQSQQQQQRQQSGQQPGQGRSSDSPQPSALSPQPSEGTESLRNAINQLSGTDQNGGRGQAGPHMGPEAPLTGSQFTQWSDQMRSLEEMVADPDLKAEIAAIRDRARQERINVKRHSKEPNWELVRTSIYGPMLELQQRIADELSKRVPDGRLVPIDRDPVPDRYAEAVRKYYEQLSRSTPP